MTRRLCREVCRGLGGAAGVSVLQGGAGMERRAGFLEEEGRLQKVSEDAHRTNHVFTFFSKEPASS